MTPGQEQQRPAAEQAEPKQERQQPDLGALLDAAFTESERPARDRILIQRAEFDLNQRYAKAFAKSGLFSDIAGGSEEQQIARALIKIELGKSMGFSAAESMTGIDIIKGRVSVGANLRASRMQRSGYTWDILQLDNNGCRLKIYNSGTEMGEVSFTVEDARAAGLAGKDNYKMNPRNMFFARAITNAQRWYAPGILSINIPSNEEAEYLDEPLPVVPPMQSATERKQEGLADKMRQGTKGNGKPQPQPVASAPAPVAPDDGDAF